MIDKSKMAIEIAELEKQFIESNSDPKLRIDIENKMMEIIKKNKLTPVDLMELDEKIQEILEK